MDELREQHLGIPRPPGTPSVFGELQAAYEAALTMSASSAPKQGTSAHTARAEADQ